MKWFYLPEMPVPKKWQSTALGTKRLLLAINDPHFPDVVLGRFCGGILNVFQIDNSPSDWPVYAWAPLPPKPKKRKP